MIHSSVDSSIMQSSQSDLIEKLKDLFFESEEHAAVIFINSDVFLFDCERSIMNSDNHIALHFFVSFFQNQTLRAGSFIKSLHCNFISFKQQSTNEDHASSKKICTD